MDCCGEYANKQNEQDNFFHTNKNGNPTGISIRNQCLLLVLFNAEYAENQIFIHFRE